MGIFALFFVMISCATPVVKEREIISNEVKYMEASQVSAILQTFKTTHKSNFIHLGTYTKEEEERLSNLIPLTDLYSPEFKPYLHMQPKKTKSMDYKADYSVHPEGVDLRSLATSIKEQDGPRCTAFAGVAAMETTINKFKYVQGLDLSETDAWYKYAVYSCDSFIRALSQHKNKICDEAYYPQYGKRSQNCEKTKYAYISNYRYLGQDTTEIIRSLNEGNPVYIGMSTPNDMVRCRPVINPENGFARGGHALLLLGYLPKSTSTEAVLIVKNSWGNCGDSGYQYMPISMLKRSGHNSAYWEIKEVNTNGDVIVPPTPTDPKCLEWKRVWWMPWKVRCVRYE
jgi:C1A family cysteine protease